MLDRIRHILSVLWDRFTMPPPRGLRAQGGWAGLAAAAVGTIYSANQSQDAAQAQTQASQRSIEEQRRQFDLIREDTEPYRDVGQNALYQMGAMAGLGSPEQFRTQNRLRNLQDRFSETDKYLTTGGEIVPEYARTYSGRGAGYSPGDQKGSAMTAEEWRQQGVNPNRLEEVGTRFVGEQTELNPEYTELESEIADLEAQLQSDQEGGGTGGGFDISQTPGYQFRYDEGLNALNNSLAASGNRFSGRAMKAAQEYGQGMASQEYQNQFNRLASLSGQGQSAVGTSGQAGMQTASGVGQAQQAIGQAQAQGAANMNRAVQGGIGNYLSYRQNEQLLGRLGSGGQQPQGGVSYAAGWL